MYSRTKRKKEGDAFKKSKINILVVSKGMRKKQKVKRNEESGARSPKTVHGVFVDDDEGRLVEEGKKKPNTAKSRSRSVAVMVVVMVKVVVARIPSFALVFEKKYRRCRDRKSVV